MDKIKRNFSFKLRYFLSKKTTRLRYLFKEFKLYRRKYSLSLDKSVKGNTLFFIVDSSVTQTGTADRFKAIVGLYYIAKVNGFDFKIIYEYPFKLQDYFLPNKVDWLSSEDEISYSLKNSRIISLTGFKLLKLNKKIRQYHVYLYKGVDLLEQLKIPNWESVWHELFNELFTMSSHSLDLLKLQPIYGEEYISVHLRFMNALDNVEKGVHNQLNERDKQTLIDNCLSYIKKIEQENCGKKIVVFSDSNTFIKVSLDNNLIVLPGVVGHIVFNTSNEVIEKSFVDFLSIMHSLKVYNVMFSGMQASGFSKYAALAGGCPFVFKQIN